MKCFPAPMSDPGMPAVERLTNRKVAITLIGALGVTFILLMGVSAISFRTTRALVQNANSEQQAQQVLTSLATLLVRVTDVESAQRGYVIAGDEAFLASYHRAARDAELEVEKLRGLITLPDQQLRLESLAPEVVRRLDRSRYIVDLRRAQGFEAIRDQALTGAGKRIQDRIKAIVGEMEQAEHEVLRQRGARTSRDARLRGNLGVGPAQVVVQQESYVNLRRFEIVGSSVSG